MEIEIKKEVVDDIEFLIITKKLPMHVTRGVKVVNLSLQKLKMEKLRLQIQRLNSEGYK